MDTMKTNRAEARRMTPLTRLVLVVAAVTVAALGIAALVGLATNGFRWDQVGRTGAAVDERKPLDLTGVDLLTIEGVSEDVQVVEATGNGAEVWLHGTASYGSEANIPHLDVERSGSTLKVSTDRTRRFVLGFSWSSLVLQVSVPTGYGKQLAVKTTSGRVQVADRGADRPYAGLALSSTSGDVELGSVNASQLTMHTTSGDIAAAGVTVQTVNLSSTSGNIRMGSLAAANEATVHTTSGDVNVAYATVPGKTDASSTSGNVTLGLPTGASFTLDARSTSGDITCDFPITIAQGSTGGRHRLVGEIGSGAKDAATADAVTVHTTSGDIRIQ